MDGCETMWVLRSGAGTSVRTSAFNCFLSSQCRYTLLPVYMYYLFEYIHVVEDLEHTVTNLYHLDELTIYFQRLNYFATKYDVSNSYIFSSMLLIVYILHLVIIYCILYYV